MAENTTHGKGLLEPILELGLEDVHFFNGRLLTALDLQKMQQANRQQHHQLGLAIGAGVVHGLEIGLVDDGSGGSAPVVSVAAGLAINRAGHAINLPMKVDVMLARAGEEVPQEAGLFQVCTPPKEGTVPPGEGVYVLAARPASGYREWVPKRGFGEEGKVDGCGRRYTVEGVQFLLEELSLDSIAGLDQDTRDDLAGLMETIDELRFKPDAESQAERRAKLSKLRNWLAHVCLGTGEMAGLRRDPFARTNGRSPYVAYGAADALRGAGRLTDCDVPLALLYWTTSRVHFVDMWSVRRGIIPSPRSKVWPLTAGDRRRAEGEAAFLQFQDHLASIRSDLSSIDLAGVRAVDYFRYLPPVGFVPLGTDDFHGLNVDTFFDRHPHRDPEFIDGVTLQAVCSEAVMYEPLDLSTDEMVWLYEVWQNTRSIDDGEALDAYVIFTSGHVPPQAIARFDVARWDYANYAD